MKSPEVITQLLLIFFDLGLPGDMTGSDVDGVSGVVTILGTEVTMDGSSRLVSDDSGGGVGNKLSNVSLFNCDTTASSTCEISFFASVKVVGDRTNIGDLEPR